MQSTERIPIETMPPISLEAFRMQMGLSPVSLWRFRKRGWLTTIVIAGRHYVTPEAMLEFKRRAIAGEFAGSISNPFARRSKSTKKAPK
jgi:hypothetical protein